MIKAATIGLGWWRQTILKKYRNQYRHCWASIHWTGRLSKCANDLPPVNSAIYC
jgi:hypothetical protein